MKREKTIQVRLRADEYEAIDTAAIASHLTLSEFVRRRTFGEFCGRLAVPGGGD